MGGVSTAKAIARRVLSPNAQHLLDVELYNLRREGLGYVLRWNKLLGAAVLAERRNRNRYRMLGEDELRAARTSDTVFVFGSGASLNEITDAEWAHIGSHDTFGFNAFYNQKWVPVGFHILRGGVYGELRWRDYAAEVTSTIAANPLYDNTNFLLQGEYLADFPNHMLGHSYMPEGSKIFRYRTARGDGMPTRSFSEGIRHVGGTLTDAVNCAFVLGWKHIVLAGVDLYDSRFFWLPPDQTLAVDRATGLVVAAERNNVRGNRYDEPHNTVRNGVVELMDRWRAFFDPEGIEISVYNPKSLLADVLPVYTSPARP
jgi:hypothetical protein